jgi:Asp-tRNA(Asn)/Glu-tRNA(Gln) amidotransferase A subunit family amidase
VAPPISPAALGSGISDLGLATKIMRFVLAPNFTGHPAISFPAGYDLHGLPIGLQAIARPWEEHLLLRLAGVAEATVERMSPQTRFDLLQGA